MLGIFVSCFCIINCQGCNNFLFSHFEQKGEFLCFSQELYRSHNHLKIFIFLSQIFNNVGHVFDHPQLFLDVLNRQHLNSFCNFCITSFNS